MRSARSPRLALTLAGALAACGVNEPRRAAPAPSAVAATPQPWGGAAIRWEDPEAGLKRARAEGKRVLVVVTAEWCPHCRNYANVFSDPRVIAQARSFVMLKLDADRDPMANRFAVDGTYIPRTLFLSPEGTIDPAIHAARPTERYFYDERDAGPLLAAMSQALR